MEYGLQLEQSDIQPHCGSLNPYSTGIWSATLLKQSKAKTKGVLILILLEYGLQRNIQKLHTLQQDVLILILLEYGLHPNPNKTNGEILQTS